MEQVHVRILECAGSPEQIAESLRVGHPDAPSPQVGHEINSRHVYAHPAGERSRRRGLILKSKP